MCGSIISQQLFGYHTNADSLQMSSTTEEVRWWTGTSEARDV